jgi:hypothetical protein
MSYLLFLDKKLWPGEVTWEDFPGDLVTIIIRSYDKFVYQLSSGKLPAVICFSNELDSKKTGYDCAKWLADLCKKHGYKFPKYVVHIQDPEEKSKLVAYIEDLKQQNSI